MVKGLAKFKEHFSGFDGHYVLIGGAACDLLMQEQGLEFRATKDLDIVLCIEALDAGFFHRFWEFVRLGGYEVKEKGESRCLYRFKKPVADDFPSMIELFSRQPDLLELSNGTACTPIPAGEDASSLSAILLDEASYHFLMAGALVIDGVRLAGADRLIPLKSFAWQNLSLDLASGKPVDSKDIKKHRRDIYRLSGLLAPALRVPLPAILATSLRQWVEKGDLDPLPSGDPALAGTPAGQIHTLIAAVFEL